MKMPSSLKEWAIAGALGILSERKSAISRTRVEAKVNNKLSNLLATGLIFLSLVGCTPQEQRLTGTIKVLATELHPSTGSAANYRWSKDCEDGLSAVGFRRIKGGDQVAIKDGDGKVLAKSTLTQGVTALEDTKAGCAFVFSAQVPKANFYSFEVGDLKPTLYSLSDLEREQWKPTLVFSD
jgi:hypothetical protein